MIMKKSHRNKHLGRSLGVVLAILILSGCSQKAVNDNAAPSIALHMKVTEPALIESVSQFLLIVSGPGMETDTTELTLNGRYLKGEVEVPAGRDRRFVVEALDETGRVIYRGSTTVDVEPGETIDLTINLYPVVPLVKLSPRFLQVPADTTFALDVKVFNIDSLYSIAFRVYFPSYLLGVDSAILGRNLDPNLFLFDTTGLDTGFYAITPFGSAPPIVDQNGNATLATIFFSTFYPETDADTAKLTIKPTALLKPNGDSIFVDSVFIDSSLIEVQADTNNPIVSFPDPMLDSVIRTEINKPEGNIYLSEVSTIDTLFADDLGISDLTGLSYLTNLEFLLFDKNQISDISELSDLISLEFLFLNNNRISNIEPLSGLVNLRWLDLQYNEITDIQPLVLNEGLGAGDQVHLTGNVLDEASVTLHIPALEERGVTVFY